MTDILIRAMNILQRVRSMEQLSMAATAVFVVLLVFGVINCILGYRLLRFWMMVFGFLLGAAGGLFAVYQSGVQQKSIYLAAMAAAGIGLALLAFLVFQAGVFILGAGLGLTITIYVIHPTTSLAFFLCLLAGGAIGALAMRYEREVIILGTSLLGGVLSGFSIARLGGLSEIPYGIAMSAGCAILGMLIQFALNRPVYEEEYEEEDRPRPTRRKTTLEEERFLAAEGLDDEAIEEAYIEGKLQGRDGFQDYFSGRLDLDETGTEGKKDKKKQKRKGAAQPLEPLFPEKGEADEEDEMAGLHQIAWEQKKAELKKGRPAKKKSPSPYGGKKGFTLVELVVVMVILAILAGIGVPALLGYLDKGKEKECQANREALINYYMTEKMIADSRKEEGDEDLTMKKVSENHADVGACPSGGTYTFTGPDGPGNISVECNKHGKTERKITSIITPSAP
ncbi:MAG: DUF4203 domain-containing protein [Eubacteriales bacterium]|nr:DUF4203 domain-containing protein [Eubacteriales bacterium]